MHGMINPFPTGEKVLPSTPGCSPHAVGAGKDAVGRVIGHAGRNNIFRGAYKVAQERILFGGEHENYPGEPAWCPGKGAKSPGKGTSSTGTSSGSRDVI